MKVSEGKAIERLSSCIHNQLINIVYKDLVGRYGTAVPKNKLWV